VSGRFGEEQLGDAFFVEVALRDEFLALDGDSQSNIRRLW
jgi:hypothetical protein